MKKHQQAGLNWIAAKAQALHQEMESRVYIPWKELFSWQGLKILFGQGKITKGMLDRAETLAQDAQEFAETGEYPGHEAPTEQDTAPCL